jgi:hypothetical protein
MSGPAAQVTSYGPGISDQSSTNRLARRRYVRCVQHSRKMTALVSLPGRRPSVRANGSGMSGQLEHVDNAFPVFFFIDRFANFHRMNEGRATAMSAFDSLFQLMNFALSHNTPRTAKLGRLRSTRNPLALSHSAVKYRGASCELCLVSRGRTEFPSRSVAVRRSKKR